MLGCNVNAPNGPRTITKPGAVLALALALACGGGSSSSVETTPAGISECGTRTHLCVRLSCRVRNLTPTRSTVTVYFSMPIPGDAHVLADFQSVDFEPNEEKTVTTEFKMGKDEPGEGGDSIARMGEDFSCSVQ